MSTMLRPVLVVFGVLTLVTGVAYPLLVTGAARLAFPEQASGSVIGGGLVKETVTTMPQSELDRMMQSHQPMTMPAPRN